MRRRRLPSALRLPSPALAGALILAPLLGGCGTTEELVWPIGEDPQRLSSTFGPRLQVGRDSAYDFHRGIDIPAAEGTHVLAMAAGKVVRAGDDPAFSDTIVQVEHCEDGSCYYSTYMHLLEACVEVDEEVEAGDVVGLSGIAESGDPHLHFEIREGRSHQPFAVHPLRRLPGFEEVPPEIAIVAVEDADPASVAVEVEVTATAEDPAVVRVEIATRDRATGEALEERVLDFEEWNWKYTSSEDPTRIDSPELDGILITPAAFTEGSTSYGLRARFSGLLPAGQPGDLEVTARALDVRGGQGEASSP